MATEVQEQRVPTDEECFEFQPPPCFAGMPVAFWRDGRPSDKKSPDIGFVLKIPSNRKTLQLYLPASGQNISNVRHISDPRLIRHPNLREEGVWDYTPADCLNAERAALTEKRLAALEAAGKQDNEDRFTAIESKLQSLAVKFGQLKKTLGVEE